MGKPGFPFPLPLGVASAPAAGGGVEKPGFPMPLPAEVIRPPQRRGLDVEARRRRAPWTAGDDNSRLTWAEGRW